MRDKLCLEVEKYLKLNYIPNKKKINLKKELEQVWDQTGSKPEKLIELEPEIPEAGKDLWGTFWEIKTQETISWTDVYNYCMFYGMMLEPYEVQIIMAMNGAYNKYIQDVERPDTKPMKSIKGK